MKKLDENIQVEKFSDFSFKKIFENINKQNYIQLCVYIPKPLLQPSILTNHELCRFIFPAYPSSNETHVIYRIIPKKDHYLFWPEGPAQYDINFVVTINAELLEFHSEYSSRLSNQTRTLPKQAVRLPVPPKLDQIEIRDIPEGGKSISIFPFARDPFHKSGDVPDTILAIQV